MKSRIYILILFAGIRCISAELAYPSYTGSVDQNRTPAHTESPLSKVEDTTVFPFRTIGRLGTGCTGTLIGPKEVLTAAHCVYSMAKNEFYHELEFSPAQNGTLKPYGTKAWDRVRAPTEWTDHHDDNFDFAMITLRENVGDSLGWLGMKVEPSPAQKPIQISGYAGEMAFGTLWHSRCNLMNPTPLWLDYDCETQGGMSGSAVVLVNEFDRTYQVIGIHALGGDEFNSGVRITSSVYKTIQNWK